MQPQFTIEPLPQWARVVDWLLLPIKHVASGTFFFGGRPQQPHSWHVQIVPPEAFAALDKDIMVSHDGDPAATRRCVLGLSMAHLPILGGWRHFVAVRPVDPICAWHIGWSTKEGVFINRTPLYTAIRKMVGPDKVYVFGVCAKTGKQIALKRICGGRLWRQRNRHLPIV